MKKRGLLKKLGAWFLTLVLASGVLLTGMTAQAETGSPAMNEPAGGAADIVLVLDVSGSMEDPFGSEDTTKRIDGLKTAVAALADEIQSINGTVGEGGEKHRVALIKFAGDKREEIGNDEYRQGQYKYNNSQIVKPLTDDMQAIKDGAGGLKSSGATRADYGLELAERYITVHSDRRQIVIFFTDGGPSSFSNYDPMVANAGVAAAKSIKDKGAEVYTIGTQSGADAGEVTEATSDSNRFLHAVSSNYPNATANDRGSLGERTGTKDYYKAATNAAALPARAARDIQRRRTRRRMRLFTSSKSLPSASGRSSGISSPAQMPFSNSSSSSPRFRCGKLDLSIIQDNYSLPHKYGGPENYVLFFYFFLISPRNFFTTLYKIVSTVRTEMESSVAIAAFFLFSQ